MPGVERGSGGEEEDEGGGGFLLVAPPCRSPSLPCGMSNESAAPESELTKLNELRHALLTPHKSLLDDQQRRYEREHGRIESGGKLLNLLVSDPEFAWLRVLSALVVQIDERLDDEEPLTSRDLSVLRDEVRVAIAPNELGGEFQRNYARALQDSPHVVMLQGKVAQLL